MRKLAITMALASTALAGPALARDNTWYAGVEGGLMIVQDVDFDATVNLLAGPINFDDEVTFEHKRGVDLDLIAGYDFGAFRAEAEAGYKRASLDEIAFNTTNPNGRTDLDGSVRVYSAMINLLLDFGDDDGWNGYIGGGAGLANVRYKIDYASPGFVGSGNDSDRSVAFQGIAGVRKAISNNVDLGLKYRYFIAPKLDYDLALDGNLSGKFKSHSLLASLIFNFAPPPPPPVVVETPPPPPPPPPATQTCYDGSVILASDVCPEPPAPPPPPPPEPAPERG